MPIVNNLDATPLPHSQSCRLVTLELHPGLGLPLNPTDRSRPTTPWHHAVADFHPPHVCRRDTLRRFDTTPSRTENAPGSGLQRPEALAQDGLARINSPVLRQRHSGVDVGQGLLLHLHPFCPLLGKTNSSPLLAYWITFHEHPRVNSRERHRGDPTRSRNL